MGVSVAALELRLFRNLLSASVQAQEAEAVMARVCCCTGYLTNPGGRCCMDLWNPQPLYPQPTVPSQPQPYSPPVLPTPGPKGWICPQCGSVMAPYMPNCTRCHGITVTVTTSDTTGGTDGE